MVSSQGHRGELVNKSCSRRRLGCIAQWLSTCSVCQKHQVPSAAKKMRGFPEMETAGFGDYV